MVFDFIRSFLHLFFPERCQGCGIPGSALCTTCVRRIPMAPGLPRDTFAVFDYGNKLVKWSIRDLKYHRRSERAHALTLAALPAIEDYIADIFQGYRAISFIFVPIPEHPRKHSMRGFNQSALLAKWWATAIPGSSVHSYLTKTIFTLPQARLNKSARLKNVANTMQCTMVLDPKQIYIIVDDVTTTGATFIEARRALGAAGAQKILCIALAHGYANR